MVHVFLIDLVLKGFIKDVSGLHMWNKFSHMHCYATTMVELVLGIVYVYFLNGLRVFDQFGKMKDINHLLHSLL